MRQQSRHLPAFILLLLGEKPLHGGAIQTELSKTLPSLKADSGAVYRALHDLEQEGYVTPQWDTSNTGPALKIYSITSSGWKRLELWRKDIEGRIQNLNFFLTEYNRLRKSSTSSPSANKVPRRR
jgi:DNA-binding PadR family transcriptional regulator